MLELGMHRNDASIKLCYVKDLHRKYSVNRVLPIS